MELQRGVCSLCAENTKVLTSSDAEHFSKILPKLFYENFLPETEFQNIKNAIKICGICCHKIEIAREAKNQLSRTMENHVNAVRSDVCYFCNTDKCVMRIEKNWKYFADRTENILKSTNLALGACPRCLFYFDVIFSFKTKLLYKFPQLVTRKKKSGTSQKQNDTPKRKSLSTSPSSTKKRKIFENCFDYLQPLCNNTYWIKDEVKRDKRLYKGIAYVDLKNAKSFEANETPKLRPIIKIKLKPKGKKFEKDSHSFVKLSRSEEVPNKTVESKSNRRHSCIEIKEPLKENLDETPKSAIVASQVPKRRVSNFIDNGETEEVKETPPEAEEVKETPEEVVTEKKEETAVEVDTNGIDKPENDDENTESSPISEADQKEETVNGNAEESPVETPAPVADIESLAHSPKPSSPKGEGTPEPNDSDSSDSKDRSKGNFEGDGSERKKKRVTFSDEIFE